MIRYLINLFRALFGLDNPKSEKLNGLEKKKENQENKLEEIDNEKNSVDDIVKHFNK